MVGRKAYTLHKQWREIITFVGVKHSKDTMNHRPKINIILQVQKEQNKPTDGGRSGITL